jgi:hypothetical protein
VYSVIIRDTSPSKVPCQTTALLRGSLSFTSTETSAVVRDIGTGTNHSRTPAMPSMKEVVPR